MKLWMVLLSKVHKYKINLYLSFFLPKFGFLKKKKNNFFRCCKFKKKKKIGESIPIRVFLAGYDLTPTMRDINKKFSVRYFLNLVLMDTEDRRYFKQQEITLWRKADKNRKSAQSQSANPHVPSHLVGSDGEIMTKSHTVSTTAQSGESGSTLTTDDPNSNENVEKTVGLFQEESPDHG